MNIHPGLYKKHGGHFLIVTSIGRKNIKVVSTQAGELQLRRTTEQHLADEDFKPCDTPPLFEAITKFAAHPGGVSEAALAALIELKERNMDVKTATTKELVDFYNKHTDSPVKKFKDRATAEARVAALLAAMPEEKEQPKAKVRGKKAASAAPTRSITVVIKQGNKESAPKEFRSVIKAFEELELPRSKMMAFRKAFWAGETKVFENGKASYEFRA